MIYTQSGGYMGIGFAIPINMAREIMEDLIYEGKVSRGWLGVSIQDLDAATRDAMGLDAEVKGVLIGDVFKGQPADKAGIKRGDVVTSVNGQPRRRSQRTAPGGRRDPPRGKESRSNSSGARKR